MEAFIKQFYTNDKFVPNEILVSHPFDDHQSIALWLSEEAGRKTTIINPKRGEKLHLVQLAMNNAQELLSRQASVDQEALAEEMKLLFNLKNTPLAIEGMDISNFQGDMAVGTIVSFIEGQPHGSGYKNYKIRSLEGVDDYGMMAELARRRLKKKNLPDLFLIDGGRGHLLAVNKVMAQILHHSSDQPDLIAIAKADERKGEKSDKIILIERKNPVLLKPDNPILHLLMRIRDEAHRRAITYHRKLSGRRIKASDLDKIPGIGPKRKEFLLKHFKSVRGLADVSIDKIREVPGIDMSLAESIYSFINKCND
jgi:excinuclease ABC subunit C